MKNEKLWSDLVKRFAKESQCRSRQVGAILIHEGKLISQGWCGAPKGTDEEQCIRCNMKKQGKDIASGTGLELAICAHAEANCIANAAYHGVDTKGSIMFCTNAPCSECAKLIVAAGIVEVHYVDFYSSEYAERMFDNANIKCQQIPGSAT